MKRIHRAPGRLTAFVSVLFVLFFVAALPVSAKGSPAGGTLILRGSMASTATLTMHGAFSVGRAENLVWDLPRFTGLDLNGYREVVTGQAFTFSTPPDVAADIVAGGRPVHEVTWANPPVSTVLRVTETLKVSILADLTPFHSRAPFPLRPLAPIVAPFAETTSLARLPAWAGGLLARLRGHHRTERGVVGAVMSWVATHVRYDASAAMAPYSASWTLAHRRATCRGFTDLAIGLLRALGIPAQAEFGWASSAPMTFPGPNGSRSLLQWAAGTQGELHTWVNIYFPDAGWVAFDPQAEKYFVDPRHVGFVTAKDAGDPHWGKWSADAESGAGPTGPVLSNGSVEMLPGDGTGGTVSVASADTFHVSLLRFKQSSDGATLFSR